MSEYLPVEAEFFHNPVLDELDLYGNPADLDVYDENDLDVYDEENDEPVSPIVLYPPALGNPDAAEAMSIAAGFREEGMNPSTALTKAWAEVRGNPTKGGDEGMLDTIREDPLLLLLTLVAGGTAVYYAVTRKWWWQGLASRPQLPVGRRMGLPPRPMRPQASDPVGQARSASIRDYKVLHQAEDSSRETIQIISTR